jgi:hypothetical protein
METPSLFFEIFSKTKIPTNDMISSHNLFYFNRVIIETTFYNIMKNINILSNLKIFRLIKLIKENRISYFFNKYKKVKNYFF